MGAPLCVGAPQRWVRRVVGVGLVSVLSVWLAAVCRVSSSAAPHGGLLWWCLGGGLGLGGSWEGAGHAGSGSLGGGGRACMGLCFCLLLSPRSLPLPFPCSSLFAGLFGLVFILFFLGGGGWGAVRWCGCVLVPAPVWAWVSWGTGVGWLLHSGFPVCAPAPRLPVPRAPVRGVLTAGGWRQWWRLRGWSRLLGSAWVAWPGVGVRVGVFMAWADGVVGSVGVVGSCGCRVRVRRKRSGLGWGTVGDAMGGGDAGDAYGGGCCRRRNGFVSLTLVLRVMRRAATGLVTLMVS